MAGTRLSKSQFVEAVANKTGLTKKQIVQALEGLNSVVTQQLGTQGLLGAVPLAGILRQRGEGL